MAAKKPDTPPKYEQLNSIDPDLVKEFSEYKPKEPLTEFPFPVNSSIHIKPEPIAKYLKTVYSSTGANLYDLTLNIIKQIFNGLVFSEAVESFGEDVHEITLLSREHPSIAKSINFAAAQQMTWWIDRIKSAANFDWKAAAFYLERRYTYNFSELKGIPRDDSLPLKYAGRKSVAQARNVKEMTDAELVAAVEKSKK